MLGTLTGRFAVKMIALKSIDLSVIAPRLVSSVRGVASWQSFARVMTRTTRTIRHSGRSVSYTHLTLPTNREV